MLMPLLRLFDGIRHRRRLRRWNTAHAWGRRGEDLAHRYLQQIGYTVVARNYAARSAKAELDIVARDGSTVVFVEVKTRSRSEFGAPDRAIDEEKRRHIIRAAGAYLRRGRADWQQARFDVVNVVFENGVSIEHIRDAFRPRH